jgi:CrcB protein
MAHLLIVGAGGFVGAALRYALVALVQKLHGSSWPLGTLAVNVVGCLVAGALVAVVVDSDLLGERARLFLMAGVLGGFTTFSAFGTEVHELLRSDGPGPALVHVGSHLLLGIGAVWLGWTAVRALL